MRQFVRKIQTANRDRIRELINLCLNTDSFEDYMRYYNELNNLLYHDSDARVSKVEHYEEDDKNFKGEINTDIVYAYYVEKHSIPIRLPKGTILTHYSYYDNIEELKSSFCAGDGVFYTSNRIYFFVDDKKIDRWGADYRYEYVCDGTEIVYLDEEMESGKTDLRKINAVYFADKSKSFNIKVKKTEA